MRTTNLATSMRRAIKRPFLVHVLSAAALVLASCATYDQGMEISSFPCGTVALVSEETGLSRVLLIEFEPESSLSQAARSAISRLSGTAQPSDSSSITDLRIDVDVDRRWMTVFFGHTNFEFAEFKVAGQLITHDALGGSEGVIFRIRGIAATAPSCTANLPTDLQRRLLPELSHELQLVTKEAFDSILLTS